MRISKSKLSEWASLKHKKNRDQTGLFLLEGDKIVREYLDDGRRPVALVAAPDWLESNANALSGVSDRWEATQADLERLTGLKSASNVVAVVRQPSEELDLSCLKNELTLVLDGVQDPGNLGTLIRLSDWFGIRQIVCSLETADWTNPKVIQASMGSFLRVGCHYVDLPRWIEDVSARFKLPVYGTFLGGQNLFQAELSPQGLIVLGNEGSGISALVERTATHKLTIPRHPASKAQSLNVATAAAIVLSEFRRASF